MSAYLFLLLLVLIGVISHNQSVIIASSVLLIIKAVGFGDQLFPTLASKGIHWGVTIITIAVLVPVGPLVGAGIAALILGGFSLLQKWF